MRRAIRDGIPGSDMPPWIELGERAVDDLTAWVMALGSPPSEAVDARSAE